MVPMRLGRKAGSRSQRSWSEPLPGSTAPTAAAPVTNARRVCSRPWEISPVCLLVCGEERRGKYLSGILKQDWEPEFLLHGLERFEAEPPVGHEFVVL